jgi:glycosyltransferase involved in cell wall biosynthesis
MEKLSRSNGTARKRICILGMEAWGGMAQHPYTLLRSLETAPDEIDIFFITLRSQETEKIYHESLFKSGRIKVFFMEYETNFSKKIRRLLFYVYNPFYHFRVARLIKKINPHIIHYSTGCVIEVLTAAFFNLNVKAKIITIHDPAPHQEANLSLFRRINNHIYHLINRFCIRRIPYFHVNAKCHVSEMKANFNIPQSRVFSTHMVSNVVEDFFDDSKAAARPNPPLPPFKKGEFMLQGKPGTGRWPVELDGLKDNTVKILFFGRIRSYKGVEYLVRAVEGLLRSHTQIQLILAGEGQLYFDCSAIKDNLILINRYISNSEISPIFTASDVVVTPYTGASQTGIISLAYFHSKPVIGTRTGGIPELIEDGKTGFLVQKEDSQALEEKIQYLVEHPGVIKEMGEAAREYYRSHYSFEALRGELLTVYRTIAGGNSAGGNAAAVDSEV